MTKNCPITIVFEHHADMNTTHEAMQFILPSLKDMGFKTIALEQPSKNNQKAILETYNKSGPTYQLTKYAVEKGFSVKSIDLINRDFIENNIAKIEPKFKNLWNSYNRDFKKTYNDKLVVDLFYKELLASPNIITRNKNFVKKLDKICKDTNAGILVNMGIYHKDVIKELKTLGYEPLSFFLRGAELENRFQQGIIIHNKKVAKDFLDSLEEIKIADFQDKKDLYEYFDIRVKELYSDSDFDLL